LFKDGAEKLFFYLFFIFLLDCISFLSILYIKYLPSLPIRRSIFMFQDLHNIVKSGVDLTMVISAGGKSDEQIVISVLPKAKEKDSDLNINKPLVVSGTPEELNAEFCTQLKMMGESTKGLVSNIETYRDLVAKQSKKTASKAKKKAKAVKTSGGNNVKADDTPSQKTLF
jgi:PRTRC genetic system protein E